MRRHDLHPPREDPAGRACRSSASSATRGSPSRTSRPGPAARTPSPTSSCPDCHKIHQGPAQKVKRSEITRLCALLPPGGRRLLHPPFAPRGPGGEDHLPRLPRPPRHADPRTTSRPRRRATSASAATRRRPAPSSTSTRTSPSTARAATSPTGRSTASSCATAEPFLCLQCHTGHNTARHPGLSRPRRRRRPTSPAAPACHPRVHGTDLPGFRIDDRFTR